MKKILFTIISIFSLLPINGQVTKHPPMGWNSFDSYGVYLDYKAADSLILVMAEQYKSAGYEYFVIDAGWYGEFDLYSESNYPRAKEPLFLNINEFGLLQPSHCYFPLGFRELIDKTHELGLKFGLHMMRGIPREAVRRNTIIKGTEYRARDIADTSSICEWSDQNYGVDMSKPGAQDYYDSVIQELADWGVDFIKYDDIVPYPKEVAAVTEAIQKCGRKIILSLSPGVGIRENEMETYKESDMMRVTNDIWDVQSGIDICFDAWKKWSHIENHSFFWFDMDMIPFGQLQLRALSPETIQAKFPNEFPQNLENEEIRYSGRGYSRDSQFDEHQKRTFITLRALSASPLFLGGDLLTMDEFSYSLLTNKYMIECNQQGIMGVLVDEKNGIEIWKSEQKDESSGFIGIFNRNQNKDIILKLTKHRLGFHDNEEYTLYDVWNNTIIDKIPFKINVQGNDVVFLKYQKK